MSEMEASAPSFEEVFGFRPPTDEETQALADLLAAKFNNMGDPTGSMAFFEIDLLGDLCIELIREIGLAGAEKHDIDAEVGVEIAHHAMIATLELFAAIRLGVSD